MGVNERVPSDGLQQNSMKFLRAVALKARYDIEKLSPRLQWLYL